MVQISTYQVPGIFLHYSSCWKANETIKHVSRSLRGSAVNEWDSNEIGHVRTALPRRSQVFLVSSLMIAPARRFFHIRIRSSVACPSYQQEPISIATVGGADDIEEGVVLDVHARVQEERPSVLVHDFVVLLVEVVQRACCGFEGRNGAVRAASGD